MSALEEDLGRIEEGTAKLQKDWERFFSGQEKKAPFEAKQRLDRLIRRYIGVEIRNNVDRFRFQAMTAKYNTLSDMWNRRLRAIEEGRHVPSQWMPREAAKAAAVETAPASVENNPAPQVATAAASATPKRAPEVRLSTLREDDPGVRDLFERFRAARAEVGEGEVKYEAFKKLISQQRSRLLEEKDAIAVDFRVAVQDGKVALKAKPVKID